MSKNVKRITAGATASQARATMKASGIHHLLVVDGLEVVGVVSERDLGSAPPSKGARVEGLIVEDLMAAKVVTAPANTTIRQAANLMRGHNIGCLVVEEDGKPAGIVTTTDLLELLGRGAERPIEESRRWTLKSRGPRRDGPSRRHDRRT